MHPRRFPGILALFGGLIVQFLATASPPHDGHFLYVAVPGVRNYLEHGGHGVLVFDRDHGYRFVKRIPAAGLDPKGLPSNVKGLCASTATSRLYITTLDKLQCLDLLSETVLWERAYPGGCDRMSITPDGRTLFLPSLEKDHWLALDASNGDVKQRFGGFKAAHNTVVSLDGTRAFLADRSDPKLAVVDVRGQKEIGRIGPFGNFIRPFTIDGRGARAYVCVDDLLGFEIGDLKRNRVLARVEVTGFSKGPVKRHGCPSHGVGLTPDEKQVWLTDAANQRLHVFDNRTFPPVLIASIAVRDQPGWITFTRDGRHALPSTGEVIDTDTRQVVATLTDELGRAVQSEKMLEIEFNRGKPVRSSDQFGLGRRR